MTDLLDLPPVAAFLVGAFIFAAGVIIGLAWPLKPDPDPDPALDHEEDRYRRHQE